LSSAGRERRGSDECKYCYDRGKKRLYASSGEDVPVGGGRLRQYAERKILNITAMKKEGKEGTGAGGTGLLYNKKGGGRKPITTHLKGRRGKGKGIHLFPEKKGCGRLKKRKTKKKNKKITHLLESRNKGGKKRGGYFSRKKNKKKKKRRKKKGKKKKKEKKMQKSHSD